MQLILTPTGGTPYVLIDGPTPHPTWVLTGQDWGNATWEHQYAGSRGTHGARAAQGQVTQRPVRLQLRLYGQSTDDMAARQEELAQVMDELRRFGGLITRRAHGQTHRQHMQVITTGGLNSGEWTGLADTRAIVSPILEFVCAPYAIGDPMGWEEPAAAMVGSLERVSGAGAVVLDGEVLRVAGTGRHLLIDAQRGYGYGDVEVSVLIDTWDSSLPAAWGVVLRYIDPANWLAATIDALSPSGYRLRIRSMLAGVETLLADYTPSGITMTRGALAARVEGTTVAVYYRPAGAGLAHPSTGWDPAINNATSVTLTAAHLATWGPGTEGCVGVYASPGAASNNGLRSWRVTPMLNHGSGNNQQRSSRALLPRIPGAMPALGEIVVTRANGSSLGAPHWALIGWAPRRVWNRCGNGDFGARTGTGTLAGWATTAVTGITGAPAAAMAAPQGGTAIVTVSGADAGIAYPLADEFASGRRYRLTAEVMRTTGSPVVRARLGNSTDLASGSNVTLTGDYQLVSVEWTPTTTVYGGAAQARPHAAITRVSGSGEIVIRRVTVTELPGTPDLPSQLEGRHGRPPLGVIPYGGGGWDVASSAGGTVAVAATGAGELTPHHAWITSVTGAGHIGVTCLVDPALAGADDYTGGETIDVEVWILAAAAATITGLRGAAWVSHPAAAYGSDAIGGRRACAPWGVSGKPLNLAIGSAPMRVARLGILPMTVDPASGAVQRLTVQLAWSAGSTGAVSIRGVILVPARARTITPTGVKLSDGGYPSLIGSAGGDGLALRKRIRSDLSAQMSAPPAAGEVGAGGLGGSLLELPAGELELLALACSHIPDDPSPGTANATWPTHLAVAVSPTPRWTHLRDI